MKKLLFILLLIPLFGLSQITFTGNNMPVTEVYSTRTDLIVQQWKSYIIDCNQLTPDTIKQSGSVNVKHKPVVVNGEISHYILSPIDTVWTEIKCVKYKEGENTYLTLSNGNLWMGSNIALTNHGAITYTTPEQVNNKINITRNKICHIKKRKASWDDFWNRWLVEKKIISLN